MVQANENVYVYDGHNRRVQATRPLKGDSYAFYTLDGTLIYRKTPNGETNYIFLGDKLIAKDGTEYQGPSSRRHYNPFGGDIGPATDDIGYTGHKFDTDLHLSYMQARYYDPIIGRFYSNDPVGYTGEADTFNRYAYVANNPFKYTDPTGKNKHGGRNPAKDVGNNWGSSVICEIVDCAENLKSGIQEQLAHEHGRSRSNNKGNKAPKPVVVSRTKHPESAQHISDAQSQGQPTVLTVNREGSRQNRKDSLKGVPTVKGKDRDEYPPAMFQEGGTGASVRPIDPSDNRGSGACIGAQCRDVKNGEQVEVTVVD